MTKKLKIDFDIMTDQAIADAIIDAMFMTYEFNYRYLKNKHKKITTEDVLKRLYYYERDKKTLTGMIEIELNRGDLYPEEIEGVIV